MFIQLTETPDAQGDGLKHPDGIRVLILPLLFQERQQERIVGGDQLGHLPLVDLFSRGEESLKVLQRIFINPQALPLGEFLYFGHQPVQVL